MHLTDRRRTLHAARHTHVNGKSLDAHSAAHPQLNVIHNFSLAAGDDSSSARLPFWALFGRPKSLKRHARLLCTLDTYMYTNIHLCLCVCVCVSFQAQFRDCCNLNSIWKRIYSIYSIQADSMCTYTYIHMYIHT